MTPIIVVSELFTIFNGFKLTTLPLGGKWYYAHLQMGNGHTEKLNDLLRVIRKPVAKHRTDPSFCTTQFTFLSIGQPFSNHLKSEKLRTPIPKHQNKRNLCLCSINSKFMEKLFEKHIYISKKIYINSCFMSNYIHIFQTYSVLVSYHSEYSKFQSLLHCHI